ncbi:MAG TPA: penicillin-binding transpeptidase domain-containing protein [Streptosporangiaceae bacterium]|nr:penicillin-binding transpeptidase domain-containing protein [Streptosporangiaceae bacterium]
MHRRRLSRRQRLAVIMVVVTGLLCVGFATGFGGASSPEPTVQAFLLDWQQGRYAQAAALTTGNDVQVVSQLTAAYTDLDATNAFLAMNSVTQHGDTAVATFKATVDLAQTGQQWSYIGRFSLTVRNGQWLVDWAPGAINPSLGPGDRLAVLTSFSPRAPVEDSAGQPLLTSSTDYHVGVYPGRLSDMARTAKEFSLITGLSAQQVLGQIRAAPPRQFLSLLTLDPASPQFQGIWSRLAKVPGMTSQRRTERLFGSTAAEVVGTIGTENSSALRAEGAAYQPGQTMGLSGLELTYQDTLAGTPSTSIVVVNAAGQTVATLSTTAGQVGTPVRTTIDSHDQAVATAALAAQHNSGEIVAVDSATGEVRALAAHQAGSVPLPPDGPLAAKLQPGMAFSIVSAAALLGIGDVSTSQPLPCENVANVGGQTFTYQPGPAASTTFAADFAAGCGTAFATMSEKLTASQLSTVERSFGIGTPWNLRVPAFSGSAAAVTGQAGVAAQATGTGGVLMSPLGMAMVAAEVDAGTGRTPVLVAADPPATWQAPLSTSKLGELRQLMRQAVQSGSARAANVPGEPVYGQSGVVQTGAHAYLSWFVGYRGSMAVAVIETGTTQAQAAAALAGAFLSHIS